MPPRGAPPQRLCSSFRGSVSPTSMSHASAMAASCQGTVTADRGPGAHPGRADASGSLDYLLVRLPAHLVPPGPTTATARCRLAGWRPRTEAREDGQGCAAMTDGEGRGGTERDSGGAGQPSSHTRDLDAGTQE